MGSGVYAVALLNEGTRDHSRATAMPLNRPSRHFALGAIPCSDRHAMAIDGK